jgi:hypothetical protein
VALDGVRFCHGSPRRDDAILTRGTPDAALAAALADVDEPLVVGGHTHQQLIRHVRNDLVYVNAGSVGLPYEGRPGAFWTVVADGVAQLRETTYDRAAAVAELRASGYPELEDLVDNSLVSPVDPDWITAFLEHTAGQARAVNVHGIRLTPWMKALRSNSGSPASMSGIPRSISPKIARSCVLASEAPRQ